MFEWIWNRLKKNTHLNAGYCIQRSVKLSGKLLSTDLVFVLNVDACLEKRKSESV